MPGWVARVLFTSWSFWFAAVLLADADHPDLILLARVAFVAGLLAPGLLAWLSLTRTAKRPVRRELRARLLDPRRLLPLDWVRALLPAALVTTAAIVIAHLVGGTGPTRILLPQGAALAATMLFAGALAQELAWRGWLQERLQETHGALGAAVRVGGLTILWQLPAGLMDGLSSGSVVGAMPGLSSLLHGPGSGAFWLDQLVRIPQAVVLAWLFNAGGRGLLAPVLQHWSIGMLGMLVITPPATGLFALLLWTLLALGVVARHGPQRLCGDPAVAQLRRRRSKARYGMSSG